jgi:hypothetical protein
MNTGITLADGQVGATATALSTNPLSGLVNVTFCNVGGLSETVVVTLLRNGGTARRVARAVLAANEALVVAGLQVHGVDTLKASTTNATSVDYVVSSAPDSSRLQIYTLDANGAVKQVNSGQILAGAVTITSSGANALAVGPNATTNPTFNVDASTASDATGVQVKGAAAGGGVALSALSSGASEALKIDAKGSGQLIIGGTSTGYTVLNRGALAAPVVGLTKTPVATQNSTPTAAQLIGGLIAHASTTGAGTATLDTAANIDTQIGAAVATGDSFWCQYANTGSQTVTITTAVGLTLKGTAAVPATKNAMLLFVRTGAGTWDVYINLSA